MKQSMLVKKGNNNGKFKLEINKVIKYEAGQATNNLLREVATGAIKKQNRLNFEKPWNSCKDKDVVT